MKSCAELAKIVDRFAPSDGVHLSPVAGVHCIKFSHAEKRRVKRHWQASFGIVVQGCKEVTLGGETYRCDTAYYTTTPIDLPVSSCTMDVSPEKPFLALKIDFDLHLLHEIGAQLEKDFPADREHPFRALYIGQASDVMLDAVLRLGKLFQHPDDAAVLAPLVIKELFYHLLKGPNGQAIRQFVRAGSKMHKVTQAIYNLQSQLEEEIDVAALAKTANMSRSAFFKHFKQVTAMSPIQYQKRLRLLEARRLMTEAGETAESSAYKVGYNSASQFSREYSRMFGNAPLRDAVKIKNTGESVQRI